MTIHEIGLWLQNPQREYATGLEVYLKYKSNNKFDEYLKSVTNPAPESMQFKMLVQRVGEIHRKLQANPGIIKPEPITVKPINIDELKKKSGERFSPISRPRIADNPLIEASQLPEDLKTVYFENKNLTKQIGSLHEELKRLPADKKFNDKRKQLAKKITDLDDTRRNNWDRIDTWWKETKLTSQEQREEFQSKKEEQLYTIKEAIAIKNRIDSLKINIQREEKRMKGNALLTEKLTPKVDEWKKELATLEEKIK